LSSAFVTSWSPTPRADVLNLCVSHWFALAGGGGFAQQTAGFLATAAAECARLTQLGESVDQQMRSLCTWVGEAASGGMSSEEVLATLWSFAVQLDAAAVQLRSRAAAAARRSQREG
jgi:hypothetical protein